MLAGREAPLFLCHFGVVEKLNYVKVEMVVLHDYKSEYSLTIGNGITHILAISGVKTEH